VQQLAFINLKKAFDTGMNPHPKAHSVTPKWPIQHRFHKQKMIS